MLVFEAMNATNIEIAKQDLSEEQLKHYLSQKSIAVDGEMMGLNLQRDRLCLIQICDDRAKTVLVQIQEGQKSAPNLQKLMESTEVQKIFHYARTDLTWLKFYLGIQTQNVFCTKIASKIARTYTEKHGLKDLTKEVTGKEMNKQQQSSDWGAEVLTADQKKYAANDVLNLHKLRDYLQAMIKRDNKVELYERALAALPLMVDFDILGYHGVLEH